MPQLINLAPPKSGTTKIYQQLLGTETVIPSGTPSKSLCEGRPLAWCQKEPTFWMKGTATLTRLQDYTSMYQPLSEKLQGSDDGSRSQRSERLMSVDWSPLNYEANPLVLRHAHPSPHFVALLRNPIHRAESDYNWSFFAVAPSCRRMPSKGAASLAGSARHMHQLMSMTVQHFGACLEHERSQSRAGTAERLCWHRSTEDRIISCSSYRTTSAYVLRGLYSVYLRWFLEHFASPHFTVARIEDLHDVAAVLPALRLGPRGATVPAARAAPVLETQRHQVQLLPETSEMLRVFYTPYVKDLQVLFNDTTLSWW